VTVAVKKVVCYHKSGDRLARMKRKGTDLQFKKLLIVQLPLHMPNTTKSSLKKLIQNCCENSQT